ncbi:MAG: HAMP domain-containing histidine kinase, partial [Flavobacteriales bacterium]|nr:HAMP domain-containing histidine kinase [Flavobacteriales bacterium]
PIHRILGITEIARQELDIPELEEYLVNIRDNSDKVLQSLTALVEFSKLDSQMAQNHFRPVDIWKSLIELRKELEEAAHRKNLKLHIPDIEPQIAVAGDKFLLQECWRIVIGNSIKFTEEGEISVTLDKHGKDVVIRITDTGRGMQEDFLPKVFQPFMQESAGFNRSHEGLGLGLSIARRYVDSHKGRIEMQSKLNKGTIVTLAFPMLN